MIRIVLLLGVTTAALAMPARALAQSEDRLSADVSTSAGYSNNPFSVASDNNTGAGIVTVDITPRYQRLTSHSTLTLSADADLQQYLRRYGHNDSYAGAVDYLGRPSERATTHARIDLSSAVLGSFNSYLPLAASSGVVDTSSAVTGTAGSTAATTTTTLPTTVAPLTQFTDIGLYGLRNRRKLGRASGDIALTVSARDSLTISGYGEIVRYAGFSTADYEAYGGSLGYRRRLSSRLSIGLTGSASAYDYRTGLANSRVYSVQATGSAQLSERWTADGAIGVSFVSSDTGASTRSTSLSGNFDLCRRDPLSNLCVQVARQVAPTGIAGSQYVTSAGLSWNRRFDERQSMTIGAGYSEIGGTTQLIGGGLPLQSKYLQAQASYNRRLARRLSLVVSANYRGLLDNSVARADDFGGQLGLSYRLGDLR